MSEQQAADRAAREQAMTDDEYHPDDVSEAFAKAKRDAYYLGKSRGRQLGRTEAYSEAKADVIGLIDAEEDSTEDATAAERQIFDRLRALVAALEPKTEGGTDVGAT